MADSKGFKALRRDVERLRLQLLPNPFDPLAYYGVNNPVQNQTRAFLLLCHAEVESYLESAAEDLAEIANNVWQRSQRITFPLGLLIATYGEKLYIPESVDAPEKANLARVTKIVEKAVKKYTGSIRENHGIKEGNFLSLFYPLGVQESALSSTLLPNLNTLGDARGKHAHHSTRWARTNSVLDPETQYKNVLTVLDDLRSFDVWYNNCKKRIR